MTENTDIRCELCEFIEPSISSDTGYACKYNPPQTQAHYTGYGEWKTFTPENTVDPLDRCGKFQRKDI